MPVAWPRQYHGHIIARHIKTLAEAMAIAERDNRHRMEGATS
jgi:hypothetical protein